MKDSLFQILVVKKPSKWNPEQLHVCLYTDGKGWFYDMRPVNMSEQRPLFLMGEVLEIEDSFQTVQQIEIIPPSTDKVIESLWEGAIAYSSSGFFGFRYFIGARIYE